MTDEKYARMDKRLMEIQRLANELRWEISEDIPDPPSIVDKCTYGCAKCRPEETTPVGELEKGDSGPAHAGLASGVPVNPAHSGSPQEHDPKCTFHVTLGGVPVTGCVPHCPRKGVAT